MAIIRKISEHSIRLIPALNLAAFIFYLSAIYLIINSPWDLTQGQSVKIMYIHVPSAWLALAAYAAAGGFSAASLVTSNLIFTLFQRSIMPIGMLFTSICLVSGSIWGKLTWGTWWEWDARLTSMLILWFLYLGHFLILGAHENTKRAAFLASILNLIGLINLPIIKFSVNIWTTLHQPSSFFRRSGIAVDSHFLSPLILMTLAVFTWTAAIWGMNLVTMIKEAKAARQNTVGNQ